MRVIFAEKPSVGRDLARVLGGGSPENGAIRLKNGDVVTWGFGHLVGIDEPGKMNPIWGGDQWSFTQLPMLPATFKLRVLKGARSQWKVVKKFFLEASELICATDAGREGELIFRRVYTLSGCKAPFQRLWISDLTDQSILDGLANLRDGSQFDDLAEAAESRAYADWLVGLNATRGYSVHNGALCTVGRVQSPTLALIVDREKAITRFRSKDFFKVVAEETDTWTVVTNDKNRFWDKGEAETVQTSLAGKSARVISVQGTEKSIPAPQLFDITQLQKECNKRWGMSAQRTMSLAQELYEKHKVLSYPRSECRHLAKNMTTQLEAILEAISRVEPEAASDAKARWVAGLKLGKRYVDDTKLTDHHAIIPTKNASSSDLVGDALNVYELVVQRFLAIFLPNRLERVTVVTTECSDRTLQAQGLEVLDVGWSSVWQESRKENSLSGSYVEGDAIQLDHIEVKNGKTEPPHRFTEGTLLDAMKYASKRVDDEALAAAMKGGGLGTGATRASIIERLIKSNYVLRRKKELVPTQKGMSLIEHLVDELTRADLTAAWEMMLQEIEEGNLKAADFMASIRDFVEGLIPIIKESPKMTQTKGNMGIGTCPLCSKEVVESAKSFHCEDRKCALVIWKEVAGKKITKTMAQKLITEGKTEEVNGFKSKAGRAFSSALILVDGKARFPESGTKEVGDCPMCDEGKLIELNFGYGCNRFKNGCRALIPKTVAGKTLTQNIVSELIEKGETSEKVKGFKGKRGGFSAFLVLDQEGRVTFEFDRVTVAG